MPTEIQLVIAARRTFGVRLHRRGYDLRHIREVLGLATLSAAKELVAGNQAKLRELVGALVFGHDGAAFTLDLLWQDHLVQTVASGAEVDEVIGAPHDLAWPHGTGAPLQDLFCNLRVRGLKELRNVAPYLFCRLLLPPTRSLNVGNSFTAAATPAFLLAAAGSQERPGDSASNNPPSDRSTDDGRWIDGRAVPSPITQPATSAAPALR